MSGPALGVDTVGGDHPGEPFAAGGRRTREGPLLPGGTQVQGIGRGRIRIGELVCVRFKHGRSQRPRDIVSVSDAVRAELIHQVRGRGQPPGRTQGSHRLLCGSRTGRRPAWLTGTGRRLIFACATDPQAFLNRGISITARRHPTS